MEKYIGHIIVSLLIAMCIWVGATLSALTQTVAEIRAKLEGSSNLLVQQYNEVNRRVSTLEAWKEKLQETQRK